jgi:hypothetical protein
LTAAGAEASSSFGKSSARRRFRREARQTTVPRCAGAAAAATFGPRADEPVDDNAAAFFAQANR